MKKLAILIISFLLEIEIMECRAQDFSGGDKVRWSSFTNARYGASVKYPDWLLTEGFRDMADDSGNPESPAGIESISLADGTTFAIWGGAKRKEPATLRISL